MSIGTTNEDVCLQPSPHFSFSCEILFSSPSNVGAVGATKLAMSSLKKPFESYDFQSVLGAAALTYLTTHGAHSEEPRACSNWNLYHFCLD